MPQTPLSAPVEFKAASTRFRKRTTSARSEDLDFAPAISERTGVAGGGGVCATATSPPAETTAKKIAPSSNSRRSLRGHRIAFPQHRILTEKLIIAQPLISTRNEPVLLPHPPCSSVFARRGRRSLRCAGMREV